MLQHITKIGYTLRPTEEVSYLINYIKESNDEMGTGIITVNTDRIGMEIDFEEAVIHISNCLPELRSTSRISSIEKKLEETDGGSESGNIYVVKHK